MADTEIIVVGAGVVGLAVAQRLAAAGREVLVLEQENWLGQHASSRNSEVVHAGLYYPPGSRKALLCRQGQALLYRWCEEHQVPCRRIGKLLVATSPDELPALEKLRANAAANGVELQPLNEQQLRRLEPELRAVAGLHSPTTGIIDSHALMQSFEAMLLHYGGQLCLNTRVEHVRREPSLLRVHGVSAGESFSVSCRYLINAGGLFAQQLAGRVEGYAAASIPPLYPCQGRYYSYAGRSPFRHLIYPMPEPGTAGLGIHATLDLQGQLRFGPDVRYTAALDYQVDPGLADTFARAIRRYWPDCRSERLQPGYTGVRAKLSGPGEAAADFLIHGPDIHGIAGFISLFGIESPGLTASLALAEEVATSLDKL
ncbi:MULTISPECIES: NAD(P)/FAD-dependent oxidoreductase [Halopseudomonas]|uniref:NAD(P)/FAD-dependent oxidoreductase n=1 Tax=Halopseudomonas bauzanensis TaxID=653930 RepID=A0A4V5NMX3_9GAMM|nr:MULTISPECIES: NAD(P)/FAD-dependent oxidoreductase [Halopseudomonas]EZQ19489.1 FAD-dependent oxidoreductase [Halopseudomonas bauzanensis]TKA93197.1 NAD(P)/FAD-dependent oxidoreductase [Halopseudomonas bauzanensis]WGK61351.1 NAD(P)/FAD-dependent oxidoreductase [Halopseudomonas sp. SMJS2]